MSDPVKVTMIKGGLVCALILLIPVAVVFCLRHAQQQEDEKQYQKVMSEVQARNNDAVTSTVKRDVATASKQLKTWINDHVATPLSFSSTNCRFPADSEAAPFGDYLDGIDPATCITALVSDEEVSVWAYAEEGSWSSNSRPLTATASRVCGGPETLAKDDSDLSCGKW